MFHLYIALYFQELSSTKIACYMTVCFASEAERRRWRQEFDSRLEALNLELELGWMTAITPDYAHYKRGVTAKEAIDRTPAEAIDFVRDAFKAAVAEAVKEA